MPNFHGDRPPAISKQTSFVRPCPHPALPPSQPSGWNLARTTCGYVMQACCSLRRWRVETDLGKDEMEHFWKRGSSSPSLQSLFWCNHPSGHPSLINIPHRNHC